MEEGIAPGFTDKGTSSALQEIETMVRWSRIQHWVNRALGSMERLPAFPGGLAHAVVVMMVLIDNDLLSPQSPDQGRSTSWGSGVTMPTEVHIGERENHLMDCGLRSSLEALS